MNTTRTERSGALLLTLLLTLTGCADDAQPAEDDRAALLATLVDGVLLPRHARFASDAELMASAVEASCEAPSDAGAEAAREAWFVARGSWKRLEVFSFGPRVEFPERIEPLVDFWPVREDNVLEVLEGDADVGADALAGYGSTNRGFPVLEYLMFGPDEDLERTATPARRCAYMAGAARDIERSASALHDAWAREGGHADGLRSPGSGEGMFDSVEESLSELVNRMWFVIEDMRRDKLGRPAGETTGGTPQPLKVESYYGARSRQDLLDALETVEEMFEIDGGLASHPRVAQRQDVVGSFRSSIQRARGSIEDLDEPLSRAAEEDQAGLRLAIERLSSAQRTIQVDVMSVLSLTINFNDADGD